ncbi:MAG TPA: transketolase C-terminal domain-containing protein [Actinomycetota bacterium]|nr:transketolase C-terminal domain-containing protein [Actinomycetota bacterium]
MSKDRATREAFGEALVRVGESDPRVVALDGDVATSVFTHLFAERFPDRYFQVGIAEQNMVGIAAGLAMAGKIPFCASFACFVTGRFDTIRMSVAYNRSNVRIVGTHVGVGIGPDGHSQMGLEDVALMRTLPNMAVVQPASGIETERAVEYLTQHVGPAYIRLTRQKLPALYDDDYRFEFGKGVRLREGSDVAIIASGPSVAEALKAADLLADHGISAAVANIHTIQPLDDDLVEELARSCGRVVTVEDHVVAGGLGGAVCECLSERAPTPVLRIGVRGFGESGDPDELYDRFGLSGLRVAEQVASFLQSPAEMQLSGQGL